jgi:hypothetical protein
MVPGIEGLKTELRTQKFSDPKVLEQPGIPVVNAGSAQNATPGIAKKTCGRLPERTRVKPFCDGGGEAARIDVTDYVRPVGVLRIVEAPNIGRCDCHRKSTLKRHYPVHLPSTDEYIGKAVHIAGILATAADGDFVYETTHHSMVYIKFRSATISPDVVVVKKSLPTGDVVANAGGCGFVVDAFRPRVYGCEQKRATTVFESRIKRVVTRIA